ncbi:Respiratory supercomplex factor 1, mitochondrial [Lecanora helva]
MSDPPLPSSFDGDLDFYSENRWQKFTRRLREEPLIPLGVGLTIWAFLNAAKSIRKGTSTKTNQFFRYRLYAQSFTLVAMLGGSYYYNADRLRRKEYTDLVKKREAQEKREKWIRELEARDLEDKEWREKLGRVRDFEREKAEKEAVEKRRSERGSDDGRGAIGAVKETLKNAKEEEARAQVAEKDMAEKARERRREMAKRQDVERRKQADVKEAAKFGDRRVWGEDGGGLFGWKRIRDAWNRRKGGGSGSDGDDKSSS